jgi:hypothetical protein
MKSKSAVSKYLSKIGKRGGQSKSKKKAKSSAENGKKGGRPPKLHTFKKPCTFPGCKITNGHEHIDTV